MTGFQIFLTVILSIVALFVIILSIPLKVNLGYDEKITLDIKYLFIKLKILPTDPNKPKKEKTPKEKKPEEPKKEEGAAPKEKKPNPILEMVKANGFDGMMEVLGNLGNVLKIFGGKLLRSIVFNKANVNITVGTGDAASTALKYGKICQKVYPVMGFLCSNNVVKHHEINISADFLANDTKGNFSFEMNICLRKIINSAIGLVFRLIFDVALKFLKNGKKKKSSQPENSQNVNNTASAVK